MSSCCARTSFETCFCAELIRYAHGRRGPDGITVSSQHDPRRRHHVVNQSTVGRHLDRTGHVCRVAHRATTDLGQQALPAGRSHVPACPTSRNACRKPSSVRTFLASLTARSLTQRRDRSRHEQEAPIAVPAAGRGRRRVTARSQLHHEPTRPSPCEVPGRGDGRHAPGHVHSDTLNLLISRGFGRRG